MALKGLTQADRLACVVPAACDHVGVVLPFPPLASTLGFPSLPLLFLAILLAISATSRGLVEVGKAILYGRARRRVA
jgi:hypothetical protein